jgi:GNAT superfamily N-acetyltransferase
METRFASSDDISTLIRLRFDFFAEEEDWNVPYGKAAMLSERLQEYFEAHLNRDFFAVLAEEDGVPASVAFLVIFDKPANVFFPTGRTGLILNVLTYPAYRKRGYATKLLTMLIDKAKTEQSSFIELSATRAGKPLYEKLGFTEVSRPSLTEMKLLLI